ncbi:class I SAM-dependent methyltransferase [Sorangium sp. So ce136]|uniref:class I SAM-dependent methyltransferase n=1 Tax=Sorangium sp. So ce136 TaxID=3133284 RepID=UPI003F52884C
MWRRRPETIQPPERFVGAIDAVVSLGVVEHFEDTAGCLRACARYLRPGGRIITEVQRSQSQINYTV